MSEKWNHAITCLVIIIVANAVSGCIENNHHPEASMKKVIEYPVVVTTDRGIVLILFEGGEAILKYRGETDETVHWELKTGGTDFYHYEIMGLGTYYFYNMMDPDNKIPCRDLILTRDGAARFGSLKDDFFDDGEWW